MTYEDRRKEWIRGRRKKRKHARIARLNRQVFRYMVVLALLWGGTSAVLHRPWRLNASKADVVVRGNHVVTSQQVKTALGDVTGPQIFQLDPRKLEKRVETLQAVKYAFVRRYAIPKPTIIVEILEEYPWATFATGPDSPPQDVISQSGRLISLKDFPSIAQPDLVIYGPPGFKLNGKSVKQWASWIGFIKAQTGEPVQSVDMRHSYEISVQDGDLFLKLGTADGTLTRRLGRLSSIISTLQPLKSRLEYVDLGLDNNIPLKVAKKSLDGKTTASSSANPLDRLQQAQMPGRNNI